MKLRKRLLSLALAVLLALPGVLLSPALPAAAQTTSDLYGTESADDINIVKLLDMALNKSGISMSPATIKAYLEYWWNSVQSDIATIKQDVGTTITTVRDFVDWMTANKDSHEWKNYTTTLRFLKFCAVMDVKTLSDFYNLISQQDTFRSFILSYVTDSQGNIAGSVNNKLQKYNIKGDLVNMARETVDKYIEEYEGYYLVPSLTYKDVQLTMFQKKSDYENVYNTLKTIPDGKLYYYNGVSYSWIADLTGLNFVGSKRQINNIFVSNGIYSDDWIRQQALFASISEALDLSASSDIEFYNKVSSLDIYWIFSDLTGYSGLDRGVFMTSDGRSVKIWKSLDAFKVSSVGQSNIYYSSDYSKYDTSVDNSIEFSGAYYSSNSSSYSHDIIQNTIDNSSEVNESTINNIVNNYVTNNNYGDSSGSSGSGSGLGSGSGSGSIWWNIGSGIESFVEGIAALLDFALMLLGKLISLVASFGTDLLELLKNLSIVGSEFAEFLKVMFGFLPEHCISVMVTSIAIMCGAGLIKLFKK